MEDTPPAQQGDRHWVSRACSAWCLICRRHYARVGVHEKFKVGLSVTVPNHNLAGYLDASGYKNPAVRAPSTAKVRQLAGKIGIDFGEQELEEMTGCIGGMLKSYDILYRLAELKPPVKYPRVPGYRPPPEENKYNAWYIKTDIKGADSGKLAGKTVAVKDCICVAGVPMMNGTKILEGYMPEFDATVITRTLDAGGRILGKSACENFCLSGNSITNDIAPVLNPNDPTRTTGGSSSGSASLVASGDVDLALSGDQGGSIRIPSGWCGIVGIKATFGLVPYTGIIPIEPTIDHVGPMARTVSDCALFLEVLAGCDGMDYRQKLDVDIPEYSKLLKSDVTGTRIGIVKEGFEKCQPDVQKVVKEAVEKLKVAGATVSEVSIPIHTVSDAIWTPVCMEGAYATLIEHAGTAPANKGFHSATLMDHIHCAMKVMPNSLSTPMKLLSLFGEYMKEEKNYHFYNRGSNVIMALTAAYDAAFEDYDVLVMPTLPFVAPVIAPEVEGIAKTIGACFSMIGNTAAFNATGHPALNINAGFSEGLPVGMMMIGRKWHEQDIFNAAYGFECIRDAK